MKLHDINNLLSSKSKRWLILTSIVLVGLLGTIDHLIGYEISFAVFYLIPIAFAAWYVGWNLSLVVSVLAALTWLMVDYTSGRSYSYDWIPVWNAFTRLAFFVVVARLLSGLKVSVRERDQLLRTDTLTGVKSLHAFQEEAQFILRSAARYQDPVSLGYIDLDRFKRLNDSMGHAVGDEALRVIGAQLNHLCRSTDIVARIGGDEFALLLPHTEREDAEIFFSRLHAHLLQTMAERGWDIGFSVGVAVYPEGNISLQKARQQADALMYDVKKNGRNSVRYRVFTDSAG